MTAGDWRPVIAPKTGRAPSGQERWAAENPGESFSAYAAAEIVRARARLHELGVLREGAVTEWAWDTLSSQRDDGVSIEPGSVQFGPPPSHGRGPASDQRPFRVGVDGWLAAGGWAAGRPGAASLPVSWVTPAEKNRIVKRWEYERNDRGWTSAQITTKFAIGPRGEKRFYWWTTDVGAAMPQPAPPVPPEPDGADL